MPPKTATPATPAYTHPDASHARKKPVSPYVVEPIKAFYCFLAANLASAVFAPIQDCDETYNYYEPTHYLSHGYGLQTWEYSPDYAIRSWLYIALHAVVGNIRRLLPHASKTGEFFFIRYILAFTCALSQTILYGVISRTLNPRIGIFFLLATILSPGNFHASTAYLPSSFAMYTAMLGAAAFMNWRGGIKTTWGIGWFAGGAVVGWPFAGALCAPFVFEEGLLALLSDQERFLESVVRVSRGIVAGILFVVFDSAVNTFFYRGYVVVPWNIIKYNVLSNTGGPNLYGTEPWTFYFRNLALNHNVWFVLALLSLPLFVLQKLVSLSSHGSQSGLRALVFISPFYLWLAIFSLQPHKEERFMYPAYPFLALNAAMSLHILLTALGQSDPKTLIGKIPGRLKFAAVVTALILSLDLGLARMYGLYSAYSAPMQIYTPLANNQTLGGQGDSVCFGKEWHRFPSSYFLPRDMRAKFIKSEFKGLLPGEFSEARTGFGFWSGTWLPTSGMNNRNQEDNGKYTELRTCAFLVDTQYPARGDVAFTPNEPDYISDVETWEEVKCVPFLDAENTHWLARAVWIPDLPVVPERMKRVYGRHCLLKRRKVGS